MSDHKQVKNACLVALTAGFCVVPPAQDGSKRPMPGKSGLWGKYQTKRATARELASWYKNSTRTGIGLVCGAVSGNLECLDFDERVIWEQYRGAAEAVGLGPLLQRVMQGYCEYTPNGVHLLYKCPEISSSEKLATKPGGKNGETLIETKAEGGYIIVAPTFGPVNPAGNYVLQTGGFDSIITITPSERRDLLNLARCFHIPGDTEIKSAESYVREVSEKDGRPGDEYNETATWPDVLIKHGWTKVFIRNDQTFWRRPGKDVGVSATTNYASADLFYPFTTSTVFKAGRGYNKFAVFAILGHSGDFSAAAKALAEAGLGTPVGKAVTGEYGPERMFYYQLRGAEFLEEVDRYDDDAELGVAMRRFALDLNIGKADCAKSQFARSLIEQAAHRHKIAVESGRVGGEKRAANQRDARVA